MTSSFPRFLAGLILVAGGALTGLTAFGIVVARWAIDLKDIAISAADSALLDDMVALTPFVGAFALVAVIVGFALLIDHPRPTSRRSPWPGPPPRSASPASRS